MSRTEEEAFVEGWIAQNVKPDGYDADDEHAAKLAARCVDDGQFSREGLERQVGDLTERMARAIEAATEGAMMERDGRIGYSGVERPPGAAEGA